MSDAQSNAASESLSSSKSTAGSSLGVSVEATAKDELLLEEVRRRYDLQQTEIDTINTKAGLVLAYFGTILVIIVTSLYGESDLAMQALGGPVVVAASVSLVSYLCGVGCCIVAIAPWTVFFPVGIEREEIGYYLSKDRDDTVLQLLTQYSKYTQENSSRIKTKNQWFLWGLVLSLVFTLASMSTVCLASPLARGI